MVTGGAGFIGSNIVDELARGDHRISIVDNLSTGKHDNVSYRANFYDIDICHERETEKAFRDEMPDVVIHNAAQIDVRKSVADPRSDAGINIVGSLNILDLCRRYGVKKIIFASSGGTIYGECGEEAPDENYPGNPISPYGIAKFSFEFYIKFYHLVYGLNYTILRYGNVYGPRQDPLGEAGVIAIFAKKMIDNESVTVFGDGKQMRDYVFVEDVVAANIKALTMGDNQTINIGTQKLVSVLDLIEIMSEITGCKKEPIFKPKRQGEILRSFLNCQKAKTELDWTAQVDIKTGIQKTIRFFESYIA
jgi:UDP-glucose 4-epimerase